jgi:hypothetical protein
LVFVRDHSFLGSQPVEEHKGPLFSINIQHGRTIPSQDLLPRPLGSQLACCLCLIQRTQATGRFDELSRGSVSCLLNASFKKRFHNATTLFFTPKIDDHGVHRGDTGQILARWRRPVASWVALDLPYWAICSVPYQLIRMAIKMARKAGQFFCR